MPVRLFAGEIDPGQEMRHVDQSGQRADRIEQRREIPIGFRAWPHGPEFDKATARTRFARRPQ